MGRKSDIPTEKRIELVLSLLRKEEPAAQIARRAGVSEPTLYRWRDEFIGGGKAQLRGKVGEAQSAKEVSRLQREIERREQVIGELTIANRILKKLSGPLL
ncbi:MAG: transposase [Xanthomonadales bacterium]|nr:transposase [Xanthomonadales bacterium]